MWCWNTRLLLGKSKDQGEVFDSSTLYTAVSNRKCPTFLISLKLKFYSYLDETEMKCIRFSYLQCVPIFLFLGEFLKKTSSQISSGCKGSYQWYCSFNTTLRHNQNFDYEHSRYKNKYSPVEPFEVWRDTSAKCGIKCC